MIRKAIAMSLLATSVYAFDPANPTKNDAMVVVSANSIAIQSSAIIRCTADRPVGLWVEPGQSAQNLSIEGCSILAVKDGSAQVTHITTTSSVESACLAGILSFGSGGRITDNQVFGCRYGLVLMGDGTVVLRNRTVQQDFNGILITGSRNYVRSNLVDRAGEHGINAVGVVPSIGLGQYLPFFLKVPLNNGILSNAIADGRGGDTGFDLRQWPVNCPNSGNTWAGNQFNTRSASCLR